MLDALCLKAGISDWIMEAFSEIIITWKPLSSPDTVCHIIWCFGAVRLLSYLIALSQVIPEDAMLRPIFHTVLASLDHFDIVKAKPSRCARKSLTGNRIESCREFLMDTLNLC